MTHRASHRVFVVSFALLVVLILLSMLTIEIHQGVGEQKGALMFGMGFHFDLDDLVLIEPLEGGGTRLKLAFIPDNVAPFMALLLATQLIIFRKHSRDLRGSPQEKDAE